jgi:uncharacterized Zn finger protein (UPF0148 family)
MEIDMQGDEETMEKYGVDETVSNPEALDKLASRGCPTCGSTLIKQGSVLICPKHGTEPFERQEE